MIIIVLTFIIFLNLIQYFIFIDIVLSWVSLLGLNIKIKFIKDTLTPIYQLIKKIIPTTFGPFELAPIFVMIIISIILAMLQKNFPEAFVILNSYL